MGTEIKKIKANDRVKRANIPGCLGTVKEIKVETSGRANDTKEKGVMINVAWDNGTVSYLSPEALELVG